MKKTVQHIILLTLLLSSILAQGQVNVLRKQIHELKEHRNFITESACPQREDVLKQYQANFDKLLKVLDIAVLVYRTPLSISKEHIKEEAEKYITYPSSNLTNVLVKRYGTKVSLSSLVSDNSSIPVGTKLLTETFTLNNTEIEVRYIVRKKFTTLINIEAVYTDKTRVFIDIQNLPQGLMNVYNTNEYGSENKNLFVLFSNEIGKLNFIQTTGYELRPEQYTEMVTANQGLVKYRYATYCSDEKGNPITPSQKGKELTIKPTNYLLWYKGTIGKSVKGSIYFFTNDNEVVGTFINAKTGKNIKLKGSYVSGFFGTDTLNLEEYEKGEEVSGYFEGKISTLKGEKEYVYEGFWISPNKEVRVPFVFKKQLK